REVVDRAATLAGVRVVVDDNAAVAGDELPLVDEPRDTAASRADPTRQGDLPVPGGVLRQRRGRRAARSALLDLDRDRVGSRVVLEHRTVRPARAAAVGAGRLVDGAVVDVDSALDHRGTGRHVDAQPVARDGDLQVVGAVGRVNPVRRHRREQGPPLRLTERSGVAERPGELGHDYLQLLFGLKLGHAFVESIQLSFHTRGAVGGRSADLGVYFLAGLRIPLNAHLTHDVLDHLAVTR